MANRYNRDLQSDIIAIIERTLDEKGVDSNNHFFKEGELATDLEVSRSTIREAITSLEIRGYVKRVHGRGVKAIDHSVEAVSNSISDMLKRSDFSYHEILQFRRIMEVKGAGIAALNRTDDDLKKMEECIRIMVSETSYSEFIDADLAFHKQIIAATQNKMLIALINSYSKVMKYAIEMSTSADLRPEQNKHFHEKIFKAIRDKDAEKAERCMDDHLDASMHNSITLEKVKNINW